ncbi:MAG: sigma 54-interacting transcriptional regulator [Bryobacteraceae bacterium]
MTATASLPEISSWLAENGPKQLELLLQAIVFHPSVPILIADSDRHYKDASSGAGRLLGVPREALIGRNMDEFVFPEFKPKVSEFWQSFLRLGKHEGTLQLLGVDGKPREMRYAVKANVLPVRHVLVLRDHASEGDVPAWVQDLALFLLNVDGQIATWYSGAERIYGYTTEEAVGQPISFLYPSEYASENRLQEALKRSAKEGHFGDERWGMRKDGTRFWANVITMGLNDESGELQGYAVAVRDFSDRHEQDRELTGKLRFSKLGSVSTTEIPGIVSGEFDRIPEVNDTFLQLIGYTREDLSTGRLRWPDLSPPEYFVLDEVAHEEALRFGACTPYDKELFRKDGTRVSVRVATAVLQLSPFRWISFIRDLSSYLEEKPVEEEAVQLTQSFEEIVGRSPAVRRMLGQVEVVAPTNATVLILGETGTGKELIARAVHRSSLRRDRPFITLNCAAIPTGLLESELFGYERGAFTGALTQKVGRFECADKGTLFLDEVGDIPLDLQPKLLRALQEKSFERLGGTKTIPIDVRLVAATNRNLPQMMGDKLFRSDLYYRLMVFPITTSPLRDHPEDIPVLARHFMRKYAVEMGKHVDTIQDDTMQALVSWPWPGNVRELENFIERSVILSRGPQLRAPLTEIRSDIGPPVRKRTLEQVEREHIILVLGESGGVISEAASRLGMPRTTLNAMMRKLGISRKDI